MLLLKKVRCTEPTCTRRWTVTPPKSPLKLSLKVRVEVPPPSVPWAKAFGLFCGTWRAMSSGVGNFGGSPGLVAGGVGVPGIVGNGGQYGCGAGRDRSGNVTGWISTTTVGGASGFGGLTYSDANGCWAA